MCSTYVVLEPLEVLLAEDAEDEVEGEGVACGARGYPTNGDIDLYSVISVLNTIGQLAESVEDGVEGAELKLRNAGKEQEPNKS